jgi:hypothetical protein
MHKPHRQIARSFAVSYQFGASRQLAELGAQSARRIADGDDAAGF